MLCHETAKTCINTEKEKEKERENVREHIPLSWDGDWHVAGDWHNQTNWSNTIDLLITTAVIIIFIIIVIVIIVPNVIINTLISSLSSMFNINAKYHTVNNSVLSVADYNSRDDCKVVRPAFNTAQAFHLHHLQPNSALLSLQLQAYACKLLKIRTKHWLLK